MPADVADVIEPVFPLISTEIVETIGIEIPEYARPLEGSFGRGVLRGVGEALGQFVGLIRDPDADRGASREVYVALGRGEFDNGRTLDALQAAYRVGARIAWRRIAAVGLESGFDGNTLALLAESIFVYIDELSSDSTDGFAQAQSEGQGERLRRERQLIMAMLRDRPLPADDLKSIGAHAGWRIPKRIAALICHERDLAEITRTLPTDVISAPVDGYGCIAVPDASGPGRFRQLKEATGGRPTCLGGEVEASNFRDSWELAGVAMVALEAGAVRAEGLLRAEEHLVELALFNSRDLIGRLRRQTLQPMSKLTPKARSRMTETALAYIEQRGNAAEMARSMHVHPQTARYRIARLRELYGDCLDQPGDRLALELSLRSGR